MVRLEIMNISMGYMYEYDLDKKNLKDLRYDAWEIYSYNIKKF
jgi:hypothetical protein